MILLLDTAANYLNIGIVIDDILVDSYSKFHPRQQSELLVSTINDLFIKNNFSPSDIKKIVLTIGPGSYTGLRIALTFTKVIASLNKIDVYVIDTLLANAGINNKNILVTLDARSNRHYIAVVNNGKFVVSTTIIDNNRISDFDYDQLIEVETQTDTLENMLLAKSAWVKVDNVDQLVPNYLKDNSQYGS